MLIGFINVVLDLDELVPRYVSDIHTYVHFVIVIKSRYAVVEVGSKNLYM